MTKVSLENLRDAFFSMEEKESLFSLQVDDGVYLWDCCRWDVYQRLLQLHGAGFISGNSQKSGFVKFIFRRVIKKIKNFIALWYVLRRKPEYIFITAQRTVVEGNLVDSISDHLIDDASNSVAIELLNSDSVSYLHMLLGGDTRIPPVSFIAETSSSEVFNASIRINKAISDYFGIYVDVTDLLSVSLAQYKANFNFFSVIFSRHHPKAVIGVNNGTLNGLYVAAKKFRIPVVELQHGSSNEHTILWSYPKSIDSSNIGLSLPVAYFTFSNYWIANTNYPVKMIQAVGNDNLYQELIESKSQSLLFISAYMYHDALVHLAMELATKVINKIYFKLHPHEYYRKDELIANFGRLENIEVVSDEFDFAHLYRLCSHVVVVHSTTAYQALQAGKHLCIYKHSNYFWHYDIFGYAELFGTSSELAEIIDEKYPRGISVKEPNSQPLFFSRFNPDDFKTAVDYAKGLV